MRLSAGDDFNWIMVGSKAVSPSATRVGPVEQMAARFAALRFHG